MLRSPLGTISRSRPLNRPPAPLAPPFRSWLGSMGFTGNTATDETLMNTYGANGTVHTIVSRLASATGAAEWKLYTKAKSGLDEDRTEVTTHPALVVWENPNKFMTRQAFVEAQQQHEDLVGETDWFVGRFGMGTTGDPMELWIVRPDRIEPIPHPDTFIDGYIYRSPDGTLMPMETTQVIQKKLPNPLDPYRGLGPVQSILTNIDAAKYSAEWNRNFFLNSAQPGGVIQFPNRLTDDRFNELVARWSEQHKGIANAHRVAMLEEGSTWADRNVNMRDMQFVELRDVSREDIREAFGYPKPMLGAVDDVNRANAEAGEYIFAKWLIVPRLERLKETLNNVFLPLFGPEQAKKYEFDYVNPVPEDKEFEARNLSAKVNALVAMTKAGYDNVEAAEFLGIPPMKWTKPDPPKGAFGKDEDEDAEKEEKDAKK